MRELFAVALSEDGTSVVLATAADARDGRFRLALDERLEAAVRGELPRVTEQEPPRESSVTPRQIQLRLRTGESVEQIASDAGVEVSRVERFAGPVFSERTQMVDSARAATLVRDHRGPSAVPLGVAVDEQLAALSGLGAGSVAWSTVRQDAGTWLVEVRYFARGRNKTCRWRYDPSARTVIAEDPSSADLAHLDEVPRRPALNPPVALVVDPSPALFAAGQGSEAPAPVRRAHAGAGAPAKRTGTTKRAAARTQPAGRVSTEAAQRPDESPARAAQGEAGPADTPPTERPSSTDVLVTPQAVLPFVDDDVDLSGRTRSAAGDEPDVARPAALRVVAPDEDPSPPAGPGASAGAHASEQATASEDSAVPPTRARPTARQITRPSRTGKRASVPAWADVLLSTSGRDDDAQGADDASAAAGRGGDGSPG